MGGSKELYYIYYTATFPVTKRCQGCCKIHKTFAISCCLAFPRLWTLLNDSSALSVSLHLVSYVARACNGDTTTWGNDGMGMGHAHSVGGMIAGSLVSGRSFHRVLALLPRVTLLFLQS